MSNYTKTTDFEAKDSLPTGDSGKIIRGAEFETEFDAISTAIATKADTAGPTFTGTLTFETISDGTIGVTAFVDEDDMSSDSATLVPTQQSVKAYVDSQVTAQDLDFQADSGGALSIDLDSETMTFTGGTGIDTSGSGNAVTFAIDSTVATLTGTQTLTNKTLTSPDVNTPDIDGGTIDGTVIGGTTAAAGSFTTVSATGNITVGGTVDGRDVATDGTKLDGIESGATADQTAAEIRTLVDSASDSNVFTDADHSKLDGIEAGATGDQTNAEIRAAVEAATDSNVFTDADHSKLDGIEASADVTDTTNVTAAGALMDSELTSIASVKALNQGVATTDSPTFAAVTVNGNVEFDGLSGTGSVTVTDILDQDDMSSNSATALATQQSIKAYVDSQVDTVDTLSEVLANGNATGGTDVSFGDNDKAVFGAGSDLQIYHNANNSFIQDAGTGSLYIDGSASVNIRETSTNAPMAVFTGSGSADLYHNGIKKLATTSTGIDVTGTVTADGLTVEAPSVLATLHSTSTNSGLQFTNGSTNAGVRDWSIRTNSLGFGDFVIRRESAYHSGIDTPSLKIESNGDISFYEDTGTTAKLFWDASAESLGIGTSSPSAPLDIVTTGDVKLKLTRSANIIGVGMSNSASGGWGFYDFARSDYDIYAKNGSVGIGNTSPDGILDVEGSITIAGSQAGVIFNPSVTPANNNVGSVGLVSGTLNAPASANASSKISGLRVAPTTSGSFNGAGEIAGVKVETFNGQSATLATGLYVDAPTGGDVNYAAILNGGNVGIGTSSPTELLHIQKAGNIGMLIKTTGGGIPRLLFESPVGTESINANVGSVRMMQFNVGGSERMRIDSSGNVGIGTSSPATGTHSSYRNLVIGETTSATSGLSFKASTTGQSAIFFSDGASPFNRGQVLYDHSSDHLAFASAGSERMRIDSSGNVMVGKTNNTLSNDGTIIRNGGEILVTNTSDTAGTFNRLSTDGPIIGLYKDGTTIGSIGNDSNNLYLVFSQANNIGLAGGGPATIFPVGNTGAVRDDAIDLGYATGRFDDVYATNGTIQTSDRNDKQDIEALSDAEQRVAVACKGLLRKFRWKSSVAENGDDARIHFGIIAQDLQAAFEAEGLDAGRYAMFINSTWTDEETGEKRSRMGVRYSELLAFIIAAI